ncbi:hypothetical protein NDU88_005176 [Pleurodeles waltl]|uniref:Uncharacterized protein n=1 Tax=Pleurodeles waltl TaxID=8319 RepID=A0AAV7M983_PLEWA|nr:hypothetical protein NDU88_005176 [Pleurodeles waltl]
MALCPHQLMWGAPPRSVAPGGRQLVALSRATRLTALCPTESSLIYGRALSGAEGRQSSSVKALPIDGPLVRHCAAHTLLPTAVFTLRVIGSLSHGAGPGWGSISGGAAPQTIFHTQS